MNYAAENNEDFGAALAFLGFLPFFLLFVVWLICGAVAASVGPQRYSGRLFVLTLFFLGPLGIASALIMKAIEDFAPKAAPPSTPPAAPPTPTASAPPAPKAPAKRADALADAETAAAAAQERAKVARERAEELRRQAGKAQAARPKSSSESAKGFNAVTFLAGERPDHRRVAVTSAAHSEEERD